MAVVVRAAASGNVMVFCEVIGPFVGPRLKAATRRVRGVDPHSVRVSMQPAALSFAVDPTRHSPQAAVDAARRGLPAAVRFNIVHVLSHERR